jgi:hypothetical protein
MQNTGDNWPANLGSPDFSIIPDWAKSDVDRVSYWLCGDRDADFLEAARHLSDLLTAGRNEQVDREAFFSFGTRLAELDAQGMVCSAVYVAEDDSWHPLTRCTAHPVAPPKRQYLIIELSGAGEPRPEVLAFESTESAESALATVRNGTGETVTVQNETGALLRVRRELIVGARISSEDAHL